MTKTEKRVNLPWVEKYRPSTLDDLVSHEDIINTVGKFIKDDQVPHLLFYGPPGTGKTSTILACAKQLYKPAQFSSMVLELNASDDRGIGIVRGQILTFASTRTIFKSGFKLIILDEADAMTIDAQNALRRIIEKYTENIRFCIICNYLSKIIPALQSRCTRFRFGPLSPEQILPRLNYVVDQERVKITEDGKQALLQLANGDMRKVLNVLQSTWLAYNDVTEDNVYSCVGHPLKRDIENIVKWLLNENFDKCYKNIKTIKILKGLALQDILFEVHKYVHRRGGTVSQKPAHSHGFTRDFDPLASFHGCSRIAQYSSIEFPFEVMIPLISKMAEIEFRLASGTNENIQLTALISAFQAVRDLTPQES